MARIRIEHVPKGYMEIWKSDAMLEAVESACEKVADEANSGYSSEHFRAYAKKGARTALGTVSTLGPSGAYYQQRDKALSKAVHP